jgi:hypothetical protein
MESSEIYAEIYRSQLVEDPVARQVEQDEADGLVAAGSGAQGTMGVAQ